MDSPRPAPPAPGRDLWNARAGAELQMHVNNVRDQYGLTDIEIAVITGELLTRVLRKIELAERRTDAPGLKAGKENQNC